MVSFLGLLLHVLTSPFKSQARLEAEIVFLRHQLNLLRRQVSSKPRLTAADRLLFVWLYRLVPSLLTAALIIQPDTIVRWHRAGFRSYWRWKSRSCGGRPKVPVEVRSLIRRMSLENALWGAPPHPWRAAEAGDRSCPLDRGQVHGQTSTGKLRSDVEDVLAQPRRWHCRDGLPCGANDQLSAVVRLGCPATRAATPDLVERHRSSDSGMDRPADHRGVSVG
jgi:hypothetical protein